MQARDAERNRHDEADERLSWYSLDPVNKHTDTGCRSMFKSCSWRTPEGKGIYGELDENGIVTFAIDAGPKSSVRGTEMFNRMMDFFGSDTRAIMGTWRKNLLGFPSANIDKVNELTGAGMALREALLQTWTVTRAIKRGFSKVRVLEQPEGSPGAYVRLVVLIERPEPASPDVKGHHD